MLLEPLVNVYKSHDTCNAKPSTEITHEFAVGVEAEASSESGSILTSSQPQVNNILYIKNLNNQNEFEDMIYFFNSQVTLDITSLVSLMLMVFLVIGVDE